MRANRQDRFFNEICLGERYRALRAGSLDAGLVGVRSIRRRRRMVRAGVLAALPLALAAVWLSRSLLPVASTDLAKQPLSVPAAPLARAASAKGVQTITEAEFLELLEQYPGHSVALVKGPNNQSVVLLGEAGGDR